MDYKKNWSNKNESGHRSNDANYWKKKASEHIYILNQHPKNECIDIGCGAGELLEYLLIGGENITEAIDYSESMLQEAKKRLSDTEIKFSSSNIITYLENCTCDTWIACQSINQYLDEKQLCDILDVFSKNSHAKSIYLFDTICPSRYTLWHRSRIIDYSGNEFRLSYFRKIYGFSLGLIESIFLPHRFYTTNIGIMGFAFSPCFFKKQASIRNLNTEFLSSLYYEYRYHVIIKKII